MVVLGVCGVFAALITVSIIAVLLVETVAFFQRPEASVTDFFFGTKWSPLLGAEKHFGIWPLVCGTLVVTAVAAVVALPFGLATAIYLSEYAPARLRAVLKPVLELLAGIPTVVYGYFALIAITPALQWLHDNIVMRAAPALTWLPEDLYEWITKPISAYNALGAGIAVGIMCLPIVSSLAEDSLRAVPRSLREGAYAVGCTRFDVSTKVVVPAALSGIIAAYLLAIARAVGETMIVALAAGGLARLTLDPRDEVQTMTGYMVQIFLGDAPAHGVEYLSSYAVAATLFVMTFVLTVIGHRVMLRYREVYH
ncbi:MAG TPA: phosphate ABC transporter permease subunit PstC [Phycisphaerales bacterium]|nr:phosphate ABC transporter permease subunit PstC [Phycisphaerales bacterium]